MPPRARPSAARKPATGKTTSRKPAAKAAVKPAAKPAAKELPVRSFPDAAAWDAWLAQHHASAPGVLLKIAKKASGKRTVDYAQALEAALCWGWIDGMRRGLDAEYFVQKFTPRARRSLWSKVNCAKALSLLEAGRMQPAGLAEVRRAQADGRWAAAYDSPSRATVPADLAAALDARPRAAAFFATVSSTNRYAVLHRIHTAKRPETRARRIAHFVDMLERGEVVHPDR